MATSNDLINQLGQAGTPKKVDPHQLGISALMKMPTMQHKFEAVLKDKAPGFISSVLNLVSNDSYLAKSEPTSIAASAMMAAVLDLPIDKNLGFAWIIPFWDAKSRKQKAQFQMGYKGYIQLALRSGQYKHINATEVYEGEIKSWDRFDETFERGEKISDKVVGYYGYFEMVNGFKKSVYWTTEQMEAHRIKFNKARNKQELTGVWRDNYDAMAIKTVLRNLLGKWGILSVEMQKATVLDGVAPDDIDESGNPIDVTDSVQEEPEQIEEQAKVEAPKDEPKKQTKTATKKSTKKTAAKEPVDPAPSIEQDTLPF